MFGWFDPLARLERRYAAATEKAENELSRSGDRAKHADLMAAAEEIGKELDVLRASRRAAS